MIWREQEQLKDLSFITFDNAGEDISNSRAHFLGTNNIVQNESMFLVNLSANVKCIYGVWAKTGDPKILGFLNLFVKSNPLYVKYLLEVPTEILS